MLINPVKSWKGKLIGMKILKRVTAVLLTAVVAVSFTACGGRSEHAKKLNIDTAVSINIWYQDDAYTSYLDYIAQQFHKANEFITVNPVKVEENNLLDARAKKQAIEADKITGDNIYKILRRIMWQMYILWKHRICNAHI